MSYQNIRFLLLKWNREDNQRSMPWKGERDPYKIWLSEIILQQTRVEQGWNYYLKFIQHYPTIKELAEANPEDVFKLWEGLGYYNRCRNLIHTAQYIQEKHNGKFPENYDDIIHLKGIGAYTAAAIASFAYNLPYVVVDGNVKRLMARLFGIKSDVKNITGSTSVKHYADKLFDDSNPRVFNQTLLDFGATICKPQNPLCLTCPINKYCYAFKHSLVNELPITTIKKPLKKRFFYYFIIQHQQEIIVHKRFSDDIWANLYEFYLYENSSKNKLQKSQIIQILKTLDTNIDIQHIETLFQIKQKLTHQELSLHFVHVRLHKKIKLKNGLNWVLISNVSNLAMPRQLVKFWNEWRCNFL